LPPRARWRCKIGLLIALRTHAPQQRRVTGCSGDFLTASPPAEKTTTCQKQAGKTKLSHLTAVEGSVASLRLDDVERK
jgi:hypothetical protein